MCERRQVKVSVSKRFMESGAYLNAASIPAARQLLLFNYSLYACSIIDDMDRFTPRRGKLGDKSKRIVPTTIELITEDGYLSHFDMQFVRTFELTDDSRIVSLSTVCANEDYNFFLLNLW
jgi:hypothetical protein